MNDPTTSATNCGRPRLFFALGPGDLVGAYASWRAGQRFPSETALTFSGQSLDFCRENGHEAMLVSSCLRANKLEDEQFVIENRPKASIWGRRGTGYFLSEVLYGLSLAVSAWRYGSRVAVIDSGTSVWFMLWPFRLLGIKVVPNFHNVYYPTGSPPSRLARRIVAAMDRLFFRYGTRVGIGVSPACARQYLEMAGPNHRFVEYRAQFCHEDFSQRFPVDHAGTPFVLLFVGRIERNKGVFDLLDMVDLLRADGRREFQLEMCGDGAELGAIRAAVSARNMNHTVRVHGRLKRSELLPIYRRSHLVVVPTRSDFCEGLPLVCVEAVLQGRPVVTSCLSNALEVLGDAAAEARPDHVLSYVERILELMHDPIEYRRRADACDAAGRSFVDPSFGLAAALRPALQAAA